MRTVAFAGPHPAHRPRTPWTAQAVPWGVRAKLKLGGAQDEAEKQADRLAARALNKAAPGGAAGSGAAAEGRAAVRRALAPIEGGERLRAPTDEEQALPDAMEREIAGLQSGGQPLPPPVRADMEARFGMDLSAVRIHTDDRAARLNETLHAHAFTVGEHIAFNDGRFQPESGAGRFLLAHELAHVAQQRGQAGDVESRPVRRGFWSDLYDSAAGALGDIVNWAVDKVREFGWRLLESIAPEFARTVRAIVDEGILTWLGRQVARAWDAYIATLRALVPFDGPRQLIDLFAGLVERAARIVAALASGNCEPLMQAISDLKTFVTETVGVAWDKLTEFLRPIGQFFSDLWNNFGAPAVRWLQDFGGAVWQGIQDLGRRFWEWIRPVREAAARIWNWFKDLLFGSSEGEDSTGSQGGVLGWISRKAGEAWDWVKERTRPVWEPVAQFASRVAELIPPAFVREMGQHAQQLATELDGAAADMNGGEGVPQSRDTLNSVLPSVQNIIATVRRIIVGAGQWLGERIGDVGGLVTGLIGRLRASDWLSWLAGAFTWLEDAVNSLVAWARDKVAVLFNWLVQGFDALTPFLELVLETVRKVITIFGDLMQLPLLILSGIWRRVPACIRDPVENFIKNQILARIPVFGQFFTDPTLWPRVQQTALNILRRIFVDGDIAGAAWLFFQSVLRILGLPPELVVQVLAKAARAIGDILTNPIGFLINLLRAMGAGFMGFFERIGSHLLTGFTGWLFGTLREAGITPPADFSLRSILGFVMEVLGVTVDNIFARLARRLDPAVVARLRTMLEVATGVWSFVATLVTEGPAGLWRELTERLSNLWDTVVQGVIGFITERVIGWASRWLLSLLDISGIMPVINTLIAIYRAIESFMQYLRQLLEIVSRVLDGVLSIARGSITEAAGFLENALASALPVAIGFLANQAGLGRLSQRLREILGGLQNRVNGAIDWLIDRALRFGRAVIDMVRRGAAAVRRGVARLREWWRARREFRVGGEAHSVYIQGSGSAARVMVASDPMPYATFIRNTAVPADKEADKRTAVDIATRLDAAVNAAARAPVSAPAAPAAGGAAPAVDHAGIIDGLLGELAQATARFMPAGGANAPSTLPVYGAVNGAGYGTSATVLRLTHNRSFRGSTPSRSLHTAAYSRLNQRRSSIGGAGSYYVLGHLLNHNLGGPGDTWQNLTPLSQGANNRRSDSMLHGFEKLVKDAVDAPRPADRKVVNFVVTANYGMPSRGADAQRALDRAKAATADNDKRRWLAIREVVQEEATVPRSVSLRAHTLKTDGTRDQQIGSGNDVENIPAAETNIDQYGVAPRNNILEDHRSEL
jgi:phage-related protein